ncbi:MAG: hypothetical protein AB9919_02100 [Geobacteraceae bacterium]
MKNLFILIATLFILSSSHAHAVVYSGAMDSRAGQQYIPGFIAQSFAFKAGGDPGEGLRLEWQADNATVLGFWTYTYRLIRGTAKSKGFAFFDIETAADFTAANIVQRSVSWTTDRNDGDIPSGLSSITISDPANFNAVHDFSNAAVTEANFSLAALSKNDLSHYSGDPGIVAPGVPAGGASDTPSVGPVPHPFYGIRVTFPGSNADLAYEAVEWEFSITCDRAPMWGSFFGWADKTQVSPFWYANFYNANIDNPVRLALPSANNLYGAPPYEGWILVPGPQVADPPSRLTVDSATYQRSSGGGGNLTVLATALPNAVLTISGDGITPVVMTVDTGGAGSFFAQIPFTALPSPIVISNSRDPVAVSPHPVIPVDEVIISQATYDPNTRVITIKAESSDGVLPLPTLTVPDFAIPNTLDATGTLVKTLTVNPPKMITVTSSKGGSTTVPVIFASLTAPTSVSLTSIPTSPQPAGEPVALLAEGTGGSGNYEYEFWLYNGVSWTKQQSYSANEAWHWITTGVTPGVYTIQVNARNSGSTAHFEAFASTNFQVTAAEVTPPAATGATLASSPTSPQGVGTSVVFTAGGTGGSGTYEYEFWRHDGVSWTKVQSFTSVNTWVWDTSSSTAGTYTIQVNVRSAGSTASFEAVQSVRYSLTSASAATGVTMVLDKTSPQPTTTLGGVTFTATGQGGTGSYEYEFWLHNGVSWTKVQNMSTTNTWNWNTALATAGNYTLQVNTRSLGSTAPFEAIQSTVFELQ